MIQVGTRVRIKPDGEDILFQMAGQEGTVVPPDPMASAWYQTAIELDDPSTDPIVQMYGVTETGPIHVREDEVEVIEGVSSDAS
jgi:hypothetical protein